MRLQSRDTFSDIGTLNPRGELVILNRDSPDAAELLSQPLKGHFGSLGDKTAVFYRTEKGLFFRLGDHPFELDRSGITADWEKVDGRRRLRLIEGFGAVFFVVDYEIPNEPLVEDPFRDEEAVDFGHFLAQVLSNRERRQQIYE
jgi:hypothetical protein